MLEIEFHVESRTSDRIIDVGLCSVWEVQAMIVLVFERLMPIIMHAITIGGIVPFVIIVQTFITAHKHPQVNSPTSWTL